MYCPGDNISGNDSCSYVSDRGGSTARAISVVAIFSSLLSCMGSVLIIYVYLRWPAIRSGSRAIITYLAIADFVTGFGYIMGSSNYLQYTSYGNVTAMPASTKVELCNNLFTPVCKIQSFLTTSSSMMSFLWTLILAIYLHTTVVKNRVRLVQQLVPLYHVIAWGLPTVVIFVMLATDVLGYAPVASANWCFIGVIRDTTLRIAMIMVGGKFLEIITYVVALVLFVSTSIRLRIQKDLAPSAFLASAAASSELAHMILPTNMQQTQLSYVDEALVIWSQGCQEQPLTGVAAHHQKSWDSLRLFSMADTLLKNTTDELNRARLLEASYTYAPSYSTIAAQQAGAVGQQAEDKKAQKYKHLSSHHFFTPVAIETSGVYGPRTADFLKELGHRLRQVSGEASSFHYLAQRLSVAIQRGNSASVMGTMDGDGEEFFV
eukprot:Em0008g566a